jgi:hypothetical protein
LRAFPADAMYIEPSDEPCQGGVPAQRMGQSKTEQAVPLIAHDMFGAARPRPKRQSTVSARIDTLT